MQIAQDVNKHVKCVTIVSFVVQILVVVIKLTELYTKMKRGEEGWLHIHTLVEDIREVVVKRIILVMDLDEYVDEILVRNS